MKIEHIALYVKDLEKSARFFENFFGGKRSALYKNEPRSFTSYFITFEDGARLELMNVPTLDDIGPRLTCGYSHIAFSLGSNWAVDTLTSRLIDAGFELDSFPRETGDGGYGSSVFDPDGNVIEIWG